MALSTRLLKASNSKLRSACTVQIFHIAGPKVDAGIFRQWLVEIEDILYQGRQ